MTTTSTGWAGLPHATGPLSPAPYVPTPATSRCECDAEAQSCRLCDGTSKDEGELEWGYRQAAAERTRLMRTSREYREAWLATFAESMREEMAGHADRRYGVLPVPSEETAA